MLSKDERARLRSLLDSATPGPWTTDGDDLLPNGNLLGVYIAKEGDGRVGQTFANCLASDAKCRANAELIATLFNAAPTLLRIAEAVAEAPEEVGENEGAGYVTYWCAPEVANALDGQRVRLVRIDHGRSGEGE